jgi:hypothetical protein
MWNDDGGVYCLLVLLDERESWYGYLGNSSKNTWTYSMSYEGHQGMPWNLKLYALRSASEVDINFFYLVFFEEDFFGHTIHDFFEHTTPACMCLRRTSTMLCCFKGCQQNHPLSLLWQRFTVRSTWSNDRKDSVLPFPEQNPSDDSLSFLSCRMIHIYKNLKDRVSRLSLQMHSSDHWFLQGPKHHYDHTFGWVIRMSHACVELQHTYILLSWTMV